MSFRARAETMAKGSLSAVMHHLRRLAAADQDDRTLLQQFIRQRDESAFAVLMRRHGGLVRRVCRGVLGHEHDAEDAFQATFLILARKARAIRKEASLASWLFGVARRTALKAKQAAIRRQQRHVPGPRAAPESPFSEAALRELQAILDEEVERLPDKWRTAFAVCCIEGRSRAEAARELGWKEGTLSARLAQARERLRQRLGRRGFSFSAVLAAGALVTEPVPAALPATLIHCRAAALFAAGKIAPGVSPQTLTLTEGVLKTMLLSKIKIATGLFLALVVAGAGLGTSGILHQTQAAQSPVGGNDPNLRQDRSKEQEASQANYRVLTFDEVSHFDKDKEKERPDPQTFLLARLNSLGKDGWKAIAQGERGILLRKGKTGEAWEYRIVKMPDSTLNGKEQNDEILVLVLEGLAAQGWDCCLGRVAQINGMLFKRPLRSVAARDERRVDFDKGGKGEEKRDRRRDEKEDRKRD
jgi:RNA polymerase sigma factor (sigma-70 family)